MKENYTLGTNTFSSVNQNTFNENINYRTANSFTPHKAVSLTPAHSEQITIHARRQYQYNVKK